MKKYYKNINILLQSKKGRNGKNKIFRNIIIVKRNLVLNEKTTKRHKMFQGKSLIERLLLRIKYD